LAAGIVQRAKENNSTIPTVSGFKAITGKGIEAILGDKKIKVVSPGYIKESLPQFSFPKSDAAETIVYVIDGNAVIGFIALADKIRDESAEAISKLKANKIKAVLLTGDNKQVAESVSTKLGMDGYFAEVLPPQ